MAKHYTISRTVSDEYLDACIQVESGGNPNSKASTSSAAGLMQALNATWLGIVKAHAPEVMRNRTQAQVLNMRYDPSFAIEMLARFTEDNQKIVGMNCTDGDLYLAHFLGAGTAKKLFNAPQNARAIEYTGSAAARANPTVIKASTTCAQLRAWAAKRMAQSGGHGWLKKYYKPAKAVGIIGEPMSILPERTDLPEGFKGSVNLYDNQVQLKAMHYYDGELDGLWGGKTSGAISAFINDRDGFMAAPTSGKQYETEREIIDAEIDAAEAEGFTRPVTEERKAQDPATVAKIAPEITPTKQSYLASLWATIAGFFIAVWQFAGGLVVNVWNFFTANKDNIPSAVTDPSTLSIWFHKIPPAFWVFGITVLLGFIAYNARKSMRKIQTDVSTGAR